MSLACIADGFESYRGTSCSRLFDHSSEWLERVDSLLAIGENGSALCGQIVEKINGNLDAANLSRNVSADFNIAGETVNIFQIFCSMERFFTGKIFIDYENGGWKQRDFVAIAIDLAVLAAHVLFPIKWLHDKEIINLGKHAQGFTSASFGLWISVVVFDFVLNCQNLSKGGGAKSVQYVVNLIGDFLDLVSLPFAFGYGMGGNPNMTIAGLAVICLSKTYYLGKELIFYSPS